MDLRSPKSMEKDLFEELKEDVDNVKMYVEVEDNEIYSEWDKLPDLILENIFSYLSMREKYWASMTCRNWYRAFYLPMSWTTFVLDDYTLTRKKFNYYSGWQYVLDHYRTMQCIVNIGRHMRYLIFEPMMNFYNLYEFMNMLSFYAEQSRQNDSGDKIGNRIRGLKFVFPCTMGKKPILSESIRIFGTGGQILGSLKRLMTNLNYLKKLELVDLMLEDNDAKFLLDEVLVISPQNICDDLIQLLGYTRLKHLHIKSNMYSPPVENCKPISAKVWHQCKIDNPELSVHIECMGTVFWQYLAPVKSLIFNSPTEMVQTNVILLAIENYSIYLETFVHQGMPRFVRSKSFHDRADSALMLLCNQCSNLRTIVIRERISTATILLIASTAKNLEQFFVRKNAVIVKTDWPKSPEWSEEFFTWLKIASRKYEAVEKEVSQILGYRWSMLTDKEFKKLRIKPYKSELD
ncbi:hypothetical protein RUM43_008341 [Polyplax serrata]|uniref:F-box domain-containing protein n=1 Tax=Polyplax serrata TaxID=468196 RepID=A0AAN8P759_POLSC